MSINLIQQKEIDKAKWDKLVDSDPSAFIFSKSWYLDAVDPVWSAFVEDDYKGALPVSMSHKGGVAHFYLPFFVRELNVLGSIDEVELVNIIDREFKRISMASSTLNKLDDWSAQEYNYQLIDVNKEYSEIEIDYSNNAKRLIKKAQKHQCELKRSTNTKWIVDEFKSGKGKTIQSLSGQSFDILENLMQALEENNAVDVFEVWVGNEKLAAACFMKYKNRITYLKGHVTEGGKSIGAMFFLMDCVLKNYSKNFEIFDFGGSKVKSVAQFYKKFGAIDSNYLFLKKDNSPKIHKAVRMLRSKIKKK